MITCLSCLYAYLTCNSIKYNVSLLSTLYKYIYESHFPVAEQRHDCWSAGFSPLL